MPRHLITTATLALLITPLAFGETRPLNVGDFDKIKTKAAMRVIYTQGPETSVLLETESGDFSDADISVDGSTLLISRKSIRKRGLFGYKENVRIKGGDNWTSVEINGRDMPIYTVHITSPQLTSVESIQSSFVDIRSLQATDFTARAASSATLKLNGTAHRAELSASSSADLEAENFRADELAVHASSSADIEATVSGAGNVNITASSSSDVTLKSLQPAKFEIDASSSAGITLSGACDSLHAKLSSSADLEAQNLICTQADILTSSGAEAEVHASGSFKGQASSGSDIDVYGNPTHQDVRTSSGGDISFRN